MKNKKLTYYFLLPAVFIIWGIIIYKIINSEPSKNRRLDSFLGDRKTEKTFIKKTYQLLENYPDPFQFQQELKIEDKKKSMTDNSVKQIKEDKWQDIRYNGLISGKSEKRVHVTISGQECICSESDSIKGGYFLVAIRKDSIAIRHKNKIRWFLK